jgi:hypothetical protein
MGRGVEPEGEGQEEMMSTVLDIAQRLANPS